MKLAQDYLSEHCGGECRGGFNARLYDESWAKAVSGAPQGNAWAARNAGWHMADSMIKQGQVFSVIKIRGNDFVFKCFADGDKFCCVGEGFVNLQESDNYAFGDSFDEAIINFCVK